MPCWVVSCSHPSNNHWRLRGPAWQWIIWTHLLKRSSTALCFSTNKVRISEEPSWLNFLNRQLSSTRNFFLSLTLLHLYGFEGGGGVAETQILSRFLLITPSLLFTYLGSPWRLQYSISFSFEYIPFIYVVYSDSNVWWWDAQFNVHQRDRTHIDGRIRCFFKFLEMLSFKQGSSEYSNNREHLFTMHICKQGNEWG